VPTSCRSKGNTNSPTINAYLAVLLWKYIKFIAAKAINTPARAKNRLFTG
jgi:hypothetical protein